MGTAELSLSPLKGHDAFANTQLFCLFCFVLFFGGDHSFKDTVKECTSFFLLVDTLTVKHTKESSVRAPLIVNNLSD